MFPLDQKGERNMIVTTGNGKQVEREENDSRRFRVYMRAGDEKRLRAAAKEVGIWNQYGEGNISMVLSMLAMLDRRDLIDLLEELSDVWHSVGEEPVEGGG